MSDNQPRQARAALPSRDLGASPGGSAAWFRRAFLSVPPQRHALMADHATVQTTSRESGSVHTTQIRAHLAGGLILAALAAVDGHATLPPLDLDAGALPTLRALLDQLVPAVQLQLLDEQLLTAVVCSGRSIEARSHAALTRLPLGRHRHTHHYGELSPDRILPIDHDPRTALEALRTTWRPNRAAALPVARPAPAQRLIAPLRRAVRPSGTTIARFNADHDLPALLSYGARRSGRQIQPCPAHPDQRRTSLLIRRRGSELWLRRCLSQHQDCALERPAPAEALRRLKATGGTNVAGA